MVRLSHYRWLAGPFSCGTQFDPEAATSVGFGW